MPMSKTELQHRLKESQDRAKLLTQSVIGFKEQRNKAQTALRKIIHARDYRADHAKYPVPPNGPDRNTQGFDDWAADLASQALGAGLRSRPEEEEEEPNNYTLCRVCGATYHEDAGEIAMRINLDELLDLAAKVEAARADVKTQAKTLLHVSEKANRLEAALRALVEGEPEVEPDLDEEKELKAGPDTGSHIKTRPWRYRDLGWHDAKEGYMDKEFEYGGADYARQAKLLGLGTREKVEKRWKVWLTEDEIVQVREATYAARIAKGLKTGIPRNRLVLVGSE